MKNNYLLCYLFGLLFSPSFSSFSAQCPGLIVNAGEDIFFCKPFQSAQLQGEIDGSFYDYKWTSVVSLSNANILDPTVSVAQTTSFILSARSHDPSTNLIVNPDFEQGNIGFDSDLSYSPGNLFLYNVYDVLTNPQSANDVFEPCNDHTSGGGNMLAGNFSGSNSPNLWCQTVAVTPSTDYYYSYWSTLIDGSITGSLSCFINGSFVTSAPLFPVQYCNWIKKEGIWYSGGNTSATICIRKGKAGSYPAGLDDIFFGPACKASDTVTVVVEKVKAQAIPYFTIPCEGVEVTLSGAGSSTGSHFNYQWDTPDGNIVSGQNTLHPVVNAPGTYTLSVSLLNTTEDCTETATVEVEIANTLHAWITAPPTLNCSSNTLLSGHTNLPGSTYQWATAGSGGNIVTGANNPYVSVNQPGDYTLLVTNTATGCTTEATVTIGASVFPAVTIQPPGILAPDNDTLTLTATVNPPNATLSWTTPNGNIVSGTNTLTPKITASGIYILTVTNPLTGCSASDTVQVAKAANCSLTANAGEDVILCGPFTPYTLNGSIDGPYIKSLWTPISAVSDPESLQPSINISQTTTFVLKARTDELGENLIVNPDFEQGNFGFNNGLEYSPGNLTLLNSYDVLANPQTANDDFEVCGDHTSGSGNMLVANLTNNHPAINIWYQSVPVTPNTDYYFSFWAAKVKPTLVVTVWPFINGQSMIPLLLQVPAEPCDWQNIYQVWNSGNNTTANISLRGGKGAHSIAIDDIFFGPFCTASDTVTVVVENVKAVANPVVHTIPCEGFEFTLNGAGSSVGPNFSYQWDTSDGNIVSGNNTLNPVVNSSGQYTLTVSVENGIGNCSKTAAVEITSSNQPQVSISAPSNLSCSSNAVLVGSSSQSASSTYQWTASQGGNIISGNNSAVAIINQPGTYTLLVTHPATGCTAEETVSIGAPILPAVTIQPPGTLNGDSDTLTLTATVNPSNATLSWTTPNGNIISGANTLTPQITAPGIYILTATNPTTGCKMVDSVQVNKVADCTLIVNAGEDAILCGPFTPYTLNGSIDGPYVKVNWTPASAVSDPESLQPSINISQTTTFVLKARTDELGENLIVNPDFEQGNFGFSSDLEYSPGNLELPDSYDVLANPQTANDDFEACGDHTSGSGNMLASNLIFNISPTDIWCQTVPVIPNTDYFFSFWATKVNTNVTTFITPIINGQSFPILPLPVGVPECEWYNSNGIWNSGNNTTATFCLRRSKGPTGIAIDDIFFAPFCTASDTVTVVVENIKAVANPILHTIPCEGFEFTLSGAGSSVGPNFTYQWDTPDGNIVSGNNTLNPVVNNSGQYTLTVSVENGIGNCSKTAAVEIESANQPQVSISAPSNLSCGSNAVLVGSSSQSSSTYQWTASQGGNIITGHTSSVAIINQPGTYTLFVAHPPTGCTAEETVVVGAPLLPIANADAAPITCAQPQTTLSGAGSSNGPNFIYAWSTSNGNILSGQNSLNAIADTAGIYVISVTNTNSNCSKTDTVAVTSNNASLPVNIQVADTITCLQSSITLATDSATAGSNLIYAWTVYSGGNIVSGEDSLAPVVNAPGLYILQVTDTLNACAGVDSITVIADNTAVIAIANAPDVITCANSSVTLNADGSSDIPSLIYLWTTSDGDILSGADSPTSIVNAVGTYQLLLTNPANGCTATDIAEVTADMAAPGISLSVSGTLNCNNAAVNLTNTSATDPDLLNHIWTNPDGSTVNTGFNPTLNVNQAGDYTLLVSNTQNGCTSTAEMTIVEHDDVAVTLTAQQNVTCFGAANGSLSIAVSGGDGVYTYLWSNDETTPAISNLAADTYTVTITDGENCSATLTATVSQPAELLANASATPISVIGASDGTATANPQGGVSPYSFNWSNDETTQTIVGLPAGFYTVTVTDANGCTVVQTVQVWDGECNLLADFQTINPLCNGSANGEATVLPSNGSAPFTYIWTSGNTEQTTTGLAAGTYSVTVNDANDCPFTGEITLTDPPPLTLELLDIVNTDCPASPEGSATVLAAGGTGAVNISWDNGQNDPTATNLTAGDYVAIATDANGCTTSITATIEAIDQEAPVIQINEMTVSLGSTGSVTLTPQMLEILATDNCNVADVQITPQEFDCFDLGEQQVTISAQDDSGNSTTHEVTITFVDLEVPVVECPASIIRCNDDNVVLYAAPVAIDNCLVLGGTFTLVAGLPSGSSYPAGITPHTYTYTDMSGNMGTCSFEINILSPLVVKLDTLMHDVNNQNIGSIQVSVDGGLPGYTYEWTKNGQPFASTEDLNGIGTGVYTLLVTDNFGCKTQVLSYEVSNIVSTETPGLVEQIAVFPNPSSGLVYVVFPDELLGSEIYLTAFDGTGRKVLEQQTGKQKQVSLDLSPFADGLYSILVRVEQEQAVWKIFVVR